MTRSNLPTIRKLRDSSSENDESELSIMTKSQELNVTKITKITNTNNFNLTSTLEENIIFCSTNEDEDEDDNDELNQACIYSCNDKIINDIKKWNHLRKLNKREPVYYCITQLEHVLNNISNILERINIENI